MKRSKSAVSTMVLAVVAILFISAAAAGIYFFVLDKDDGTNTDWSGLDFSDPMIEGTLGVGTEYTYSYIADGGNTGELKMTIIGQSGSYYAFEIESNSMMLDYSGLGMVHKRTGELRFSESLGTEGEYDGESLNKWKLVVWDKTETDKTGSENVTTKYSTYFISLSNSNSILPYEFHVCYDSEENGQKMPTTYEIKATLIKKDLKSPAEYEISKHIGDMGLYSLLFKRDNDIIGHGNQYVRIVGDTGPDEYLNLTIYESDTATDERSLKIRLFDYYIDGDFIYSSSSRYSQYDQGDDKMIDANWGNKNCEYYYSVGDPIHKHEMYVGKDDRIPYFMKDTWVRSGYIEYEERTLEEYAVK